MNIEDEWLSFLQNKNNDNTKQISVEKNISHKLLE